MPHQESGQLCLSLPGSLRWRGVQRKRETTVAVSVRALLPLRAIAITSTGSIGNLSLTLPLPRKGIARHGQKWRRLYLSLRNKVGTLPLRFSVFGQGSGIGIRWWMI